MKDKKRLLFRLFSILIVLGLAVPLSSTVVRAQPAIEIWDWYDLDAIRNNPSGSYVLMSNLDSATVGYDALAGSTANGGKGWQPIGTFTGVFDGQGYEIREFFISRAGEWYVGLFGYAGPGSSVGHVGAVNFLITGDYGDFPWDGRYFGSLAGINYGTITDCYCAGTSAGPVFVGGLVGYNQYSGAISGCYCSGVVSAAGPYVGGLAGYNRGTVTNCSSSASVTGGDDEVAGLVGCNQYGTITDSCASGDVTGIASVGGLVGLGSGGVVVSCRSATVVAGSAYVGGLVGYTDDTDAVADSYCTGSVTGGAEVGGLVGMHQGAISGSYSTGSVTGSSHVGGAAGLQEGIITDSYATGSVAGSTYVGGLAGSNYRTISNSYSIGSVAGSACVGGLVGVNYYNVNWPGVVSNSFWDIETSGQATSAGGTGRTTAEMKDIATFAGAGWDIGTTAVGNPTGGYPFLSWQVGNSPTWLMYGGAQNYVVGWETCPVNKTRVLLPWIVLLAAIVAGASILGLKRRGRGSECGAGRTES